MIQKPGDSISIVLPTFTPGEGPTAPDSVGINVVVTGSIVDPGNVGGVWLAASDVAATFGGLLNEYQYTWTVPTGFRGNAFIFSVVTISGITYVTLIAEVECLPPVDVEAIFGDPANAQYLAEICVDFNVHGGVPATDADGSAAGTAALAAAGLPSTPAGNDGQPLVTTSNPSTAGGGGHVLTTDVIETSAGQPLMGVQGTVYTDITMTSQVTGTGTVLSNDAGIIQFNLYSSGIYYVKLILNGFSFANPYTYTVN